jgi:mannose-6-phosphate isomerase-like protein (cupin superfamily)
MTRALDREPSTAPSVLEDPEVVVSEEQLAERTIRRSALVSCDNAFIDVRTPGSETKENYALIGPGVSQSSDQFVNLRVPHGYNIGAAAMPNGVTNNLHLHFSAEVFLNFRGDWNFRWGTDTIDGELVSSEGDILSIPTWIFRGFTNVGVDDGFLFTVLGQDDTGGIIWGPSVLRDAAGHGLYLRADNTIVDTAAGQPLPEEDELIRPMTDEQIARLRHYSVDEMRRRVVTPADRRWSEAPFVCSGLPGGGARLALVVGYGMTEDREQEPPITNPHGFSVAWLGAAPGEGMLRHRHAVSSVLMVKSGRWRVTLNEGAEERSVELADWDTLSVPEGAWRRIECIGDTDGELVVVNGGDVRVRLEWAPEVVAAARAAGVALDSNGYVAPYELVSHAVADD